ncbi:methylmalonyl-CoA mutase family protein [Rossellomorea aquimaris]|uniref:methylmalonyl-CoA mutase family protein n=1 Tax=Rossellomorea aquimaris TaxID=189382 RepID=UPI001CD25CD9|nr:methylmalonyl-CoA mutase family protein [Rossellomorea aquimaris]MCA1054755.1 methylmalonyl-CoA mutase family protein [Rossellomorea aquimaris]
MKLSEMKDQTFNPASLQEWQEAAEKALKGRSVETLHTKTYEGIELKPLFTEEDLPAINRVDAYIPDINHKISSLNEWRIAQTIKGETWEELSRSTQMAVSRGQNCLSFSIKGMEFGEGFETFVKRFKGEALPFFNIEKNNETLLDHMSSLATCDENPNEWKGVIGYDPLSESGFQQGEYQLDDWAETVTVATSALPEIKTIVINTTPYHGRGANAVQELSYALSTGVHYIETFQQKGWSPVEIAKKMHVHFSVGSHFFMEVAKIRAFKKLWKDILSSYGIDKDVCDDCISLSAETSQFNKSCLDEHVNLLRTGGEAFSAVLAGVNYLIVHPFDGIKGETTPLSERIARNIQLILGEEAHLNKVFDPAGGSYYVEWLTEEVGRKAWEEFQHIDREGGILDSLRKGKVEESVSKVLKARVSDLSTRSQSMIGTNIYANPEDLLTGVETLNQDRLSLPFEKLRRRAEELVKSDRKPVAGIIGLGELKSHKARADFVGGFLSTGGIHSHLSDGCFTKEDILMFIEETNYPYYVVCGQDEEYDAWLPVIIETAANFQSKIKVDVAGKFNAERMNEWTQLGLNGSIYYKQNMLDKLNDLLSIWEEEKQND